MTLSTFFLIFSLSHGQNPPLFSYQTFDVFVCALLNITRGDTPPPLFNYLLFPPKYPNLFQFRPKRPPRFFFFFLFIGIPFPSFPSFFPDSPTPQHYFGGNPLNRDFGLVFFFCRSYTGCWDAFFLLKNRLYLYFVQIRPSSPVCLPSPRKLPFFFFSTKSSCHPAPPLGILSCCRPFVPSSPQYKKNAFLHRLCPFFPFVFIHNARSILKGSPVPWC